MSKNKLPENLQRLHSCEEQLRAKAFDFISKDDRLTKHLQITELAMDVIDIFRRWETEDEDIKVIQMLGLRIFNDMAAAIKLVMSGYNQSSALILRDVLETVFLIDLFRSDRSAITRWRMAATAEERLKEFRPVRVREKLDCRDGFTEKKRMEMYKLFSELAGHPSMQGFSMLRPKGMDAQMGPFIDSTALEAVVSELGRLAVQVGELISAFMPDSWEPAVLRMQVFNRAKDSWIKEFYKAKN